METDGAADRTATVCVSSAASRGPGRHHRVAAAAVVLVAGAIVASGGLAAAVRLGRRRLLPRQQLGQAGRESFADAALSPTGSRRGRDAGGESFSLGTGLAVRAPERVHLFPTSIDPDCYRAAEHTRAGGACELIWIGSRSTAPSLFSARPGIAAATGRLPGLKTKLICDWFPDLPGVRVIPCRWSAETEAAELAAADIGVSWLPDHPWSRGKCGLKVLQYMAAGLPVVANPIGVHREMIEHGRTGFLAETADEWCGAITKLAQSAETRARMGREARRVIAERYNIHSRAHDFVRLLVLLAEAV